ncbi:hypothetical protein ACFC09_45300 [Streptomyces sp. NPDC056161]|uniref:hypothetical protein n=1 Tax=Streptomyces sp. NPDC056161 TaxID=3345732 RepID=UPI0035DCF402
MAIVLGLIGAVAKGLVYLLIIGVIVLVADIIFFGVRLGRRRGWGSGGRGTSKRSPPVTPAGDHVPA